MDRCYQYEVELKLTNPNTGAVQLVTRTEWAYTITDALVQASVAAVGTGSDEVKLIRVGPTADAIAASNKTAADALRAIVDGVMRGGVKAPAPTGKAQG